ncbi:MAG: DegT/DnrJ/EryC1/StrS family aminotransferase [Syntrophomonas sp.]
MKISLLDLASQYQNLKDEIDKAIAAVLNSGVYIMGASVSEFENSLASFLNVKHAIAVASGSDALTLSLHSLGIKKGDKIIVPTFTFFATAGAVVRLQATPVFVDIDPRTYNLDLNKIESLLKNDPFIKGIIPVHLFGLPVDMQHLMELAHKYNLVVVEDACQAINADILQKTGVSIKAGTIGDTGCFSFFPTKNLSCFGDGGMIVTNQDLLANRLRILRVHGSNPKYYHSEVGYNSRLDAIQAAVLTVKLKYLNEWTQKRQNIAHLYSQEFSSQNLNDKVVYPELTNNHVFHQYCIQVEKRDELAAYLKDKGITTAIYYPLPLHLQECFKDLEYHKGDLPIAELISEHILALPIDPELNPTQIHYIVSCIRSFIEKQS